MLNLLHIATHRAGSADYYSPRARGTVEVVHDSKRYVYRQPQTIGCTVGQFRAALIAGFGSRGQTVHIAGRFPSYRIDTSC